jgi:ATP-dependent exoDNAse (exonuclease V) alpha subunit
MVGDVGQIAAVEAGSPFRQLQENALDPIRLDANLRQRDDVMKLSVAKLQSGLVREAFDTLAARVVQNADPVASAASAWLALDDTTRAKTVMFTSGHRLREQLLDTVRAELVREGKLGSTETRLPVLERLNLSQEQMRKASSYAPGMVLDVHRDSPAIGLPRGQYPVLAVDAKAGTVQVGGGNQLQVIRPGQLHQRGTSVSLSIPAEIGVRIGDTLQWTANDRNLGIANGQAARLDSVDGGRLTLSDPSGKSITLAADSPMRERLAHGLVTNMHKAQGTTVEHAITVMASDDRALNTQSLTYVLSSRARGGFELHVDNRDKLINQIERSSGVTPTALNIVAQGAAKDAQPALQAGNEIAERGPSQAQEALPVLEKRLDFGLG